MLFVTMIIIASCLIFWVLAMDRVVQLKPVLPAEARRRVPWSLFDMTLIGILSISILLGSSHWNRTRLNLPDEDWRLHELTPVQQIALLKSFALVALISALAGFLICRFRARATFRDLGWNFSTLASDIGYGVAGYCMLVVPMLLVHMVAQWVFRTGEMHPFIEMILEDPRPEYLWPIGFASIFVAPITEEFFFRVVFQGWLERIAVRLEQNELMPVAEAMESDEPTVDQVGKSYDDPDELLVGESKKRVSDSSQDSRTEENNPWSIPRAESIRESSTDLAGPPAPPAASRAADDGMPITRAGRTWPIIISSFAFAMAHVGQGPAPISLFLLALGLGYTYQRTHRILPCVTIHFLINLTAMVQLWQLVASQG